MTLPIPTQGLQILQMEKAAQLYMNTMQKVFRYHFGEASPNPWATGSGLFLSAGLRYSYSKYIVYDVMQFVASRPIFYGPIGSGLSYTNSFTEFPIGAGYIYSFGAFKIEPSFHLLYIY